MLCSVLAPEQHRRARRTEAVQESSQLCWYHMTWRQPRHADDVLTAMTSSALAAQRTFAAITDVPLLCSSNCILQRHYIWEDYPLQRLTADPGVRCSHSGHCSFESHSYEITRRQQCDDKSSQFAPDAVAAQVHHSSQPQHGSHNGQHNLQSHFPASLSASGMRLCRCICARVDQT